LINVNLSNWHCIEKRLNMLDGNSGENDKPSVEEQYATAVGSSNLRVGNDSSIRTPGDLIAQAGMNKHRMGLALRRLMTEWDATPKPPPMEPKRIEAMAAKLAREEPTMRLPIALLPEQIAAVQASGYQAGRWEAFLTVPNPHVGKVRVETDGKVSYLQAMVAANQQARDWHAHELGLLFQRLKSLPAVREALVFHAEASICEPGEGVHLVCAVLQWWLNPTCPMCAGRKLKVVAGTGRTSSKACGLCKGSGERKVPHGWQGRRLLSYMNECRNKAAKDLSAGTFAHQRKTVSSQS
jgi:hypothetical protein